MTSADPVADFLARGGRVSVCPPMPAMGDFRLPHDMRAKAKGGRQPPMSAAAIDAVAVAPVPMARSKQPAKAAPHQPRIRPNHPAPKASQQDAIDTQIVRAARLSRELPSLAAIAQALGVDKPTASSYLSRARRLGLDVRRLNTRPGDKAKRVRRPPAPGTRLPPTTAAVVALKAAKMSHRQVAEELDTTIAAVKWHVRHARMCSGEAPPGPCAADTERNARIAAAHAAGESNRSIAKREGISSGRVWQIVDRARKDRTHG